MVTKRFIHYFNLTHWVSQRYTADCTDFKAHGGVATSWNRITIPRTRKRAGRGCKVTEVTTATLSSRLALHLEIYTLYRVQLRILGS